MNSSLSKDYNNDVHFKNLHFISNSVTHNISKHILKQLTSTVKLIVEDSGIWGDSESVGAGIVVSYISSALKRVLSWVTFNLFKPICTEISLPTKVCRSLGRPSSGTYKFT